MILLIATTAVVVAQIYFSTQGSPGFEIASSLQLQAAIVIAGSLLRGLGIALILVAVFISRRRMS